MIKGVLAFSKIKSGDIHAFETLFRSYYEPLCHYAFSFVCDMDTAEDIVQELFYILWVKREKLQVFQSVKSYLYGATRNNSLLYIRNLKVKRSHFCELENKQKEEVSSTPQEELEYEELKKRLDETLLLMPERRRKIFCMNRFDGKKYTEIATELNLSVKTIEVEISKVLSILKKDSHFRWNFPDQMKRKNEEN